jgi:hypothetical protein
MSIQYIKAWNDKGKSFEISYKGGIGIYFALKDSAERKVELPESWKKEWPSLNEMYLSFMDPNGEIINFQFMEKYTRGNSRVVHQMYFKQGCEQRTLVFETPEEFIIVDLSSKVSWEEDVELLSHWPVVTFHEDPKEEAPTILGVAEKLSDSKEKAKPRRFFQLETRKDIWKATRYDASDRWGNHLRKILES